MRWYTKAARENKMMVDCVFVRMWRILMNESNDLPLTYQQLENAEMLCSLFSNS